MTTREILIEQIQVFLAEHRMSDRAFSLLVGRDHKWLARLRRGQVTLQAIERAEAVLRGEVTMPMAPKRAATADQPSAPDVTQQLAALHGEARVTQPSINEVERLLAASRGEAA